MQRSETISAIEPLLRHQMLRVLLVAAPGLTSAVAILAMMETSLPFAVVFNVAAGVIISSALFITVSIVARRVADERIGLVQKTEQELSRARAEAVSIYDATTGLHADWYFRARLQEEIDRSRRYRTQFAVLVVKPTGLHRQSEMAGAGAWFSDHIERHLRGSDVPALLDDGNLAAMMPNTSVRSARTVQRRITADLAPVEPQSGLACYPGDGDSVVELLAAAGSGPSKPASGKTLSSTLADVR